MKEQKIFFYEEACKLWDLSRLFEDLSNAKRKLTSKNNNLTFTEKEYLCGLLLINSPSRMAEILKKNQNGIEVTLSRTIYRYVEKALNKEANSIENWRDVSEWLALSYKLNNGYASEVTPNQQYWGEAVDISNFYGRTEELESLESWICREQYCLVSILGIGGVGKTALSVKIARKIQSEFEFVVWLSLRHAPPVEETLKKVLQLVNVTSDIQSSNSINEVISTFLESLRKFRYLIILDNVESVLKLNDLLGNYREGYEMYGELFRRLGEESHKSCLILTSREQPKELSFISREKVQCLRLSGLNQEDGRKIIEKENLSVKTEDEWRLLVERCAGNPMVLKMIANTIHEIFNNSVHSFLQNDTFIFGGVRELLDQQFTRLPKLEKDIMYWLAINRVPTSLEKLRNDFLLDESEPSLVTGLKALKRRSLIEMSSEGYYTQQPLIMEYVTENYIKQIFEEILENEIDIFMSHSLIKAQAEEFIRESQTRIILIPILNRLFKVFGKGENLKNKFDSLLLLIRSKFASISGYAAGNLLTLVDKSDIPLAGYDFSNLVIWQSYLVDSNLRNINFAYSDLSRSVFPEFFSSTLCVAFSPQGNLWASGHTRDICIWRAKDSKPYLSLKAHTGWVRTVAFSSDGTLLASGSDDQTIKIWNVETGACLKSLAGHQNRIRSVNFSPIENILLSGSDDQTIRLWDISTGECKRVIANVGTQINSVIFSPDGDFFVTCGNDRNITLWRTRTGHYLKAIKTSSERIRTAAFSSDGELLATGGSDYSIELWNIRQEKPSHILQGHNSAVTSICFKPNSSLLASSSADCTVRLWDISTGACISVLEGHTDWVNSIAFNSDGSNLISGSSDQSIRLWDIESKQCLKVLRGYANWVWSVSFSPDGQTLVTGSNDKKIRLWNISNGECFQVLKGHRSWVWSVSFSPDGQTLASASSDGTIKLWNVQERRCLKTLIGHTHHVRDVAFSSNGKLITSGSYDQTVKIWDIGTEQCIKTFTDHSGEVRTVKFASSGKFIASGSCDKEVKVFDISSGECIKTLKGHSGDVWSISISPDDQLLASGGDEQNIFIWNLGTEGVVQTIEVGSSPCQIRTVCFDRTGSILATGGSDCCVKIWDIKEGRLLFNLRGHTHSVRSLCFSPNDSLIASSSEDETIRLWCLKTGACTSILSTNKPYEGVNITGVRGLEDQMSTLINLGAFIDRSSTTR